MDLNTHTHTHTHTQSIATIDLTCPNLNLLPSQKRSKATDIRGTHSDVRRELNATVLPTTRP